MLYLLYGVVSTEFIPGHEFVVHFIIGRFADYNPGGIARRSHFYRPSSIIVVPHRHRVIVHFVHLLIMQQYTKIMNELHTLIQDGITFKSIAPNAFLRKPNIYRFPQFFTDDLSDCKNNRIIVLKEATPHYLSVYNARLIHRVSDLFTKKL